MMKIENCYECGGCVAVCPTRAITIIDEVIINIEKCVRCGICELMCPVGLIDIKSIKEREIK